MEKTCKTCNNGTNNGQCTMQMASTCNPYYTHGWIPKKSCNNCKHFNSINCFGEGKKDCLKHEKYFFAPIDKN